MNLELLIKNYKDLGIDVLRDLIFYKTVLDKYEENGEYPFGIENKKALDFILAKGEEFGFVSKNVDNYAGHIEFGSGDEILGVLAHIDVVPVEESEWISNPFKLDIRENKLFGRGTTDDKGPLVASLIAMKALKDEGFVPNKKIRLIMGCDEESGSRCLERYLEKEAHPNLAFSPDADFPLIYGEKAIISFDIMANIKNDIITYMNAGERYNIVPSKASFKLSVDLKREFTEYLKKNNYKGEVDGDTYITYGVSSHAMAPQKGVNALFIAFDFIKNYDSKLAKFMDKYFTFDCFGKKAGYNDTDPEMHDLTSNLAIAKTDGDTIKLGFNVRAPKDSAFDFIPEKLNPITKEYGYEFKFLGGSKRHYVSPKSELVQKLLKSYRFVTNNNVEPITIGGGTYARELGNAVAFGPQAPGAVDVCHISNEYMSLDDFYTAIKVYYTAIKELAK